MTKTRRKINTQENTLDASIFLDKKGDAIKVSDVIDKKDCWFLKSANKWILTHNAIKIIARIAGISMNYDVVESPNIVPDYRNELEHIVRVTIHCKANKAKDGEGCVHSDERELTVTGESNRISTPNRGRGYLRKMAEKRAFDIAVLEHLNLYHSIFSEEESSEFENKKEKEQQLMPGTKEFEDISTEINAILATKTLTDIRKVRLEIKKKVLEHKYSDVQHKYLRALYQKELAKKSKSF